MERIPISLRTCLLPILGCAVIAGCSGGESASVTAQEEEMFKHPGKVDMSKIPKDALSPKGPAFIGKPTGATHPSGGSTPPGVAAGS